MTTYRINDNGIDRDMTEEETAEFEATKLQVAKEAKANDKTQADLAKLKADTLTKLGLTADEVAALLS
jgi:ribosomal 50S subunit-associated protein YjgA (DUF615 family)